MSGRVIHLLRHGPPVRTGLLLGHTDEPPLVAECPHMRDRVKHLPVMRIVTSDLSRASLQAAHLSRHMGVPFIRDPNWRELHFGAWEGLAPDAMPKDALSRFWADPEANPPPDGERWSDLNRRVAKGLADMGGETLVVTHAGAMRAALSVLTGLDHRAVWAIDLPYLALLSLRVWPEETLAGQVVGLDTGYRE